MIWNWWVFIQGRNDKPITQMPMKFWFKLFDDGMIRPGFRQFMLALGSMKGHRLDKVVILTANPDHADYVKNLCDALDQWVGYPVIDDIVKVVIPNPRWYPGCYMSKNTILPKDLNCRGDFDVSYIVDDMPMAILPSQRNHVLVVDEWDKHVDYSWFIYAITDHSEHIAQLSGAMHRDMEKNVNGKDQSKYDNAYYDFEHVLDKVLVVFPEPCMMEFGRCTSMELCVNFMDDTVLQRSLSV